MRASEFEKLHFVHQVNIFRRRMSFLFFKRLFNSDAYVTYESWNAFQIAVLL